MGRMDLVMIMTTSHCALAAWIGAFGVWLHNFWVHFSPDELALDTFRAWGEGAKTTLLSRT